MAKLTAMVREWQKTAIRRRDAGETAAADVLLGCAEELARALVSVEVIKKQVCREFQVSMTELVSDVRTRRIVRARNVAMSRCRERTDATLEEIGRHFNRSHSAVLHGIRRNGRG